MTNLVGRKETARLRIVTKNKSEQQTYKFMTKFSRLFYVGFDGSMRSFTKSYANI
jgi:hypothetical protein